MVFVYVTGIATQEEAAWAISRNVSAIGIPLGYEQGAFQAEAARDIFFSLPFYIWKVGIFGQASPYDIGELASFCHLDICHFRQTPEANLYSEGQRILQESFTPAAHCDGWILPLENGEEPVITSKKPLLLAGDFPVDTWQTFLTQYCAQGLVLDFHQPHTEEVLTWLTKK